MKKVDRLLMKARDAQRTDDLQVGVCLVEKQDGGEWETFINLWNDNHESEQIVLTTDTMEEAMAAIDRVKSEHIPVGRYSKVRKPVIIINDGLID